MTSIDRKTHSRPFRLFRPFDVRFVRTGGLTAASLLIFDLRGLTSASCLLLHFSRARRRSAPPSTCYLPPTVFVPSAFCFLLSAFCFLVSACGYHVAGRGDRLPPALKTVAIPIFVNESSKFRIEQKLTAAVTREFIERTRYKITPNPSEADAALKGTVKDVRTGVIAFDLNTGRATTLQIQVTASVELVDLHTKKVLFSNPNYVFREEYQISQTTSGLFQEEDPAFTRLSQDLARTLVTEILENF